MVITNRTAQENSSPVMTLDDLAELVNYSMLDTLNPDPEATSNGVDHNSRQVFSGHFVPVNPTPIENPEYVFHSKNLFNDLGFSDQLAQSLDFVQMFSGDLSHVPLPMRKVGWACGYALSIYGREYYQQCPFQTGNGYGDGRAVSVLEAVIKGQRREMQLKGGGPTPYCRGADGRAVLRSSVREFLAQEHMHALGVPTSRSLSLFVSKTEKVNRPWYSQGSVSQNPDVFIPEPVAITTRVASSFIRVGQLELFGRRARKNEHPGALEELEKLVLHLIDREYAEIIDKKLPTSEKVVCLAREFRGRLTALVANWIRVGYCQGNFNSDNCAGGGFTLDYGPFGFCEAFDPQYQPWTGGGHHFAFMNQPVAAERNFYMFCIALKPLLSSDEASLRQVEEILDGFSTVMEEQMEKMWAAKLGTATYQRELVTELEMLMAQTPVDYTIFFRELSMVPDDIEPLKKSFYSKSPEAMETRWTNWHSKWKAILDTAPCVPREELSTQMKLVNPKYSLREWLIVPTYQEAGKGNYNLMRELNEVMTRPYAEQSEEIEKKYYRPKPSEFFGIGGFSHLSCSS